LIYTQIGNYIALSIELSLPSPLSSHVLVLYNSSISLSVIVDFAAISSSPKPALLHLLTHCIAAKSLGDIPRQRGSSRSPSSLNIRSHSQLEARIDSTSRTSLLRLGYYSRSPIQYCIGSSALGESFPATSSQRLHLVYSSLSSVDLVGLQRLSIASLRSLESVWGCT
jgi:hypothetical protein